MRFVDLQRVERSYDQVGKIGDHLAVDPIFHFAVILPDGVRFDHQLIAIPASALRQEIRHRREVWILRGRGEPLAARRFDCAGRIPMIAEG